MVIRTAARGETAQTVPPDTTSTAPSWQASKHMLQRVQAARSTAWRSWGR